MGWSVTRGGRTLLTERIMSMGPNLTHPPISYTYIQPARYLQRRALIVFKRIPSTYTT